MATDDIIGSIRRAMVPIHREGWPFVAAFFVASVVLGWIADPLFWIGLALTVWCAFFFRDPQRVTPVSDDFVIAPADGRISAIQEAIPPRELEMGEEPRQRISIFMNVFNCHVNRSPVRGRILRQVHRPGKFLNAELDKASQENERNSLRIEGPHGDVAVVQIAGLVARRIVSWTMEGTVLTTGERIGLIRFGSRVDVYLPDGAVPAISLGQIAVAGETILARHDGASVHPVTRAS